MRSLLLVLLASPAFAASPAAIFRSGPARTRLLELYTSEACSSCPPADSWLAGLRDNPRLWVDFVPAAFHVDYWDYLNWKDRFDSPAFSLRQRAYARAWGGGGVYTPEFILDGRDWRDWGAAAPPAHPDAGVLSATVRGGSVLVRFSPGGGATPGEVLVARLGFGLSTTVTDGENAGRVLRHEFVVRGIAAAKLSKRSGVWTAEVPLPADSAPPSPRSGVAVWVTGADGRPLQAAGGYLP